MDGCRAQYRAALEGMISQPVPDSLVDTLCALHQRNPRYSLAALADRVRTAYERLAS